MPAGKLTMLHGAALYSGAVLGTGVLVLPSMALQIAGPASLVAWALLILLSIPLATTFAVLGSRYPASGGVSSFAQRAFGWRFAGITGWIFYGGVMLGTPSAAMMGGLYMAKPFHAGHTVAVLMAAAIYIVAVVIIGRGLRASAGVQLVVAALLAVTLVTVCAFAVPYFDADNLVPFAPNGVFSIGKAASLLMFAFVGWEAVAPMTSDFKRPSQDVPRATAVALCITSLLYLMLAGAVVLTQPANDHDTAASLLTLLSPGFGDSALWIMALIAALLTLGALLAYINGGAKQGSALAAQGFLAPAFAAGHVRGTTPLPSLALVTGVALAVFASMAMNPGTLEFAIHASAACFTAVYVLGTAAAIQLLREERRWAWVATLAFALACILLFFSGPFLALPIALGVFGTIMGGRRANA